MHFIPFGGGHKIGASAYFLKIDGLNLLIDAGLHPDGPNRRPDFDALCRLAGLKGASDLDAIFITHAHADHVGGLLDLLSKAPLVPAYFHPHTGLIARQSLERQPGLNDAYGRRKGWLRFVEALEYNGDRGYHQPFFPHARTGDSSLEVTFLDAGHIPGSSAILFRGREGSALITGDFNDRSTLFLTGTRENPAYDGLEVDLLITEGTYAGRPEAQGVGVFGPEGLAPVVARVVARRGVAVIPCFALARAQEVLGLLAHAIHAGQIPPFPLWYDPMVAHHCRLYAQMIPASEEVFGWLPPRFETRPSSLNGPEFEAGGVMVVSPGMVQVGSPVTRRVAEVLPDPQCAVIITGHQVPGSLGARLEALARSGERPEGVHDGNRFLRLRAELYSCSLSAHADHAGLMHMVQRIRPRKVALIHRHGDEAMTRQFQEALAPIPVLLPRNGERLEILP